MTANPEFENGPPEKAPGRSRRRAILAVGIPLFLLIAVAAAGFAIRGAEAGHLDAGRAAAEAGDWPAAIAALDQALSSQPAFLRQHVTEATALRGLANYWQGDLEAALADLDAVLENDPEIVDLYVYRSDIHYRQGHYQQALADGELALAHADLLPDFLLALLYSDRAAAYLDQGEPQASASETDLALALDRYLADETVAGLYAGRALVAFESDKAEMGLADSMAALNFGRALPVTTRADLLANITAFYHGQGLVDLILETSDTALALDALTPETKARLSLMRADAFFQLNNLTAAIAEAKSASSLPDGEALLHALQAWEAYLDGDAQLALDEAELALATGAEPPLAFRVRGAIYAWQGKIDEALVDLNRALELEPGDVEALAMRLFAHLELNDLDAARSDLAQAQENNPGAPATLWAEAQVAIYNYDYREAKGLLDAAIELDGDRPEFYFWRSITYLRTDEQDMAEEDIERALDLDEDFPFGLVGRMGLQRYHDELDAYEASAKRLAERYPEWYISYLHLGYSSWRTQDDQEKALGYFEQVLEYRPESTVGYLARARVHLADKAFDLAQEDIEQALVLRPNSIEARIALVDLHVAQEEYDEALAIVDEILAVLPDSASARLMQARVHRSRGELDQAWEMVHQALAYDPGNRQALAMRADLYMDAGDLDAAILDLRRLLEDFPNSPYPHLTLARAYYFQGRPDEARDLANRALELDPDQAGAYLVLIWVAMDQGQAEGVLEYAQQWVETDPESALAHYWLAAELNHLNRYQEAAEALLTAIDLAPDGDPLLGSIYLELAYVYLNRAEDETAQEYFNEVLALSTNLNQIDQAESWLARPGMRAQVIDGRRVIEDQDNGFTVSYAEGWRQTAAEPAEGYVLSLAYDRDGEIIASVDGFIIEWNPGLSVYDLASFIDPASEGGISEPLEAFQIAGRGGLKRIYQTVTEFFGPVKGHQYFMTTGNQAVILVMSAVDSDYAGFAAEFDAIAASFDFLE